VSARDVAGLAERLYEGYLVYDSAMTVATDPRSERLAPERQVEDLVSVGRIASGGSSDQVVYDFRLYLARLADPAVELEYRRLWLKLGLIALGDALARDGYFTRTPELEVVKHLRNASAHGDVFEIRRPNQLASHPAHVRRWGPPGPDGVRGPHLEITAALHGTRLWDFVDTVEVLSLFQVVGRYLGLLANGQENQF
jgi:hypothetical protein